MSSSDRPIDTSEIRRVIESRDPEASQSLADRIAAGWPSDEQSLNAALDDPAVRRWVRTWLLDRLSDDASHQLAVRLLQWSGDFRPEVRDRSTRRVVEHATLDDLRTHLSLLAGSNVASALWDRLASSGEVDLRETAIHVLRHGDVAARETTLHLLVLDPYGPQYLSREEQNELLQIALHDEDEEIRGLAAEVIAADLPGMLLDRWESAPADTSERVRMAFWNAALVHRPDEAFEAGASMVLDTTQPLGVRRTALLALGENLATRTVSPVLQALLRGDDETLAEDAAELMWRHHRAPDIATSASESQFESVRERAERLLHPEKGSPAAGGSRPGDPTRTGQIFDQISGSGEWRGPDSKDA